jgi:ACT domain-containing protein
MKMKAVITVTGKDTMGIIAKVSAVCADKGANILDITQSVLSEYFAMIMLTDISELKIPFADFADGLAELGKSKGLDIHTMHEDIFNSMHRI